MDNGLRLLCLNEGAFLRRDALAMGYDDKAIRRALRDGVIVRVRYGAYTFADQWTLLDPAGRHRLRAHAATRSAHAKHALSHVTSVLHHTDAHWDLDLRDVHLTRFDGRAGRAMSGVRQHRGLLSESDIVTVGGVVLTSPTRAALELTTVTDVERALVVTDSLLHLGATSRAALAAMGERMTFWPSTLTTDLVIRLSDERSESPGETRFRYLCWRAGLPPPRLQYEVRDPSGHVVARVDFAWPERGLFVEFDGLGKYSAGYAGRTAVDVVIREKQREDLVRRLTGWRCLRVVWADLEQPERTAHRVRQMLSSTAEPVIA